MRLTRLHHRRKVITKRKELLNIFPPILAFNTYFYLPFTSCKNYRIKSQYIYKYNFRAESKEKSISMQHLMETLGPCLAKV